MLTIQIVTKNNQQTIKKCLQSIQPLKAKIKILDIGCTDETIAICQEFDCQIIRCSLNNDYSNLRNEHLGDDWNFYLDPHEELVSGHDEINEIVNDEEKAAFYFSIIQGTVLTKEIRLWNNGSKFVNPVYETIKSDGLDANWLILSQQSALDLDHRFKLIEIWKKTEPLSKEPYYYQALTALLKRNYAEFERLAEHYLETEKQGMSSTMFRYYLAMVQAYETDNLNAAARNALICISIKPLMAEFWCLLGDIQYRLKNYQKAIAFYENAVILGGRRLKSDRWPMDISKYKEYPIKMVANSEKIMAETKLYHRTK